MTREKEEAVHKQRYAEEKIAELKRELSRVTETVVRNIEVAEANLKQLQKELVLEDQALF